jgi:hypothetical protein
MNDFPITRFVFRARLARYSNTCPGSYQGPGFSRAVTVLNISGFSPCPKNFYLCFFCCAIT